MQLFCCRQYTSESNGISSSTPKEPEQNNYDGDYGDDEIKNDFPEIDHISLYTLRIYVIIGIPMLLSAGFTMSYVFTAGTVSYRCLLTECEDPINTTLYPTWLTTAVPYTDGVPTTCTRYTVQNVTDSCSTTVFTTETESCDAWIYETDKLTILNEWDLTCDGNLWKLSLPGTINNVGQFSGLIYSGYVSDRYGRRNLLVLSTTMATVLGLIRSFSVNYEMFVIFEFLDAMAGAGLYSAAFVLGMEFVGPKKRVFISIVMCCMYSVGEAVMALCAMWIRSWRHLILALYVPGLIAVFIPFLVPESVRWLLSKGRGDEAESVLRKIAVKNGVEVTQESIDFIKSTAKKHKIKKKGAGSKPSGISALRQVLRERVLMFRLMACTFCWITNTLVYYGLSLQSVTVGGDQYVNFILVALVEIPANFACWVLVDYMGRKPILSGSFFLSGVFCILTIFIPEDWRYLTLIVFLGGKCSITIAFSTIYVYTTEMFPTPLRHSLLGFCSMIARIGSMIAPQMPLLATYMASLPMLVLGAVALVASILSLIFPETTGHKLPDTIQEAVAIGQLKKKPESITPYYHGKKNSSTTFLVLIGVSLVRRKMLVNTSSISNNTDENCLRAMYPTSFYSFSMFTASMTCTTSVITRDARECVISFVQRVVVMVHMEVTYDPLFHINHRHNCNGPNSKPTRQTVRSMRLRNGSVTSHMHVSSIHVTDVASGEIGTRQRRNRRRIRNPRVVPAAGWRLKNRNGKSRGTRPGSSQRLQSVSRLLTMDFDEVLEELGELGKFQLINYFLICLPVFFSAANSLSYVFVAGVPEYRCYIEGCDDRSSPNYLASWVNQTIPDLEYETQTANDVYVPSQCSMYLKLNSTVSQFVGNETCPFNFSTNTIIQCSEWIFDPKDWTIVSEWNLTCQSNLWKLSLIGTVHFAGIFCGSSLFGMLADRFGRKLMFITSIMLMTITGIGQVLSGSYNVFNVFVFLNAVGTAGIYPLAFILGVELVGKKKRELCGIFLNYFYALGEAAVALFAWWFGSWRFLQLAVSAPAVIFLCYYWLVPESVRWLLARNENVKAKSIVSTAAKTNKVVLSSRILESMEKISSDAKTPSKDPQLLKMLGLAFHSRLLVTRISVMFYVWAATAFVYYGLSVNSTSLSGDKYLNFALVCLVEIPGYTLALYALPLLGRRWALIISLLICTVTCGAAAWIFRTSTSLYWVAIVLFLIGKFAITAAFGILYVYTAELFPTAVRSCAVGLSSTMARIGAMIAPFAPMLSTVTPGLPLMCFAAAPLLAAILTALLLPETRGRRLPNTVREAEAI
ncbi:uncharacterized protein LOC124409078 [Diprion similis]|uniref:uncharacterized protein LOC124409078 n=1 Tax=Diprion similis TaxID=362088 RepID=UPI001EF86992|nr:uncharacterized protein LOC124409078 [Diprion similis]